MGMAMDLDVGMGLDLDLSAELSVHTLCRTRLHDLVTCQLVFTRSTRPPTIIRLASFYTIFLPSSLQRLLLHAVSG